MADRVRVYGRDGIGLCDLRVTVERSWYVNDEGEAQFDLVINDPNCRDDYLQFGNWLLVENDKLESWVGMIENQEWKRRFVTIQAFTPDRLLYYRDVPKQLQLSGTSGNVFQEVINISNRAETTIIESGDIDFSAPNMPLENMAGANLRDYIIDLAERSKFEYNFTPAPYQGKLKILANWKKRIGTDTNFGLEESYNLADETYSLKRKAPRATELWGYGNGAGQTDRPVATYVDEVARGKYGLRQGTRFYSDYSSVGAVISAIKNEIRDTKEPREAFKLSAVDIGNTFENIKIGNIYPLRMWSIRFGVNELVRLLGVSYSPHQGKAELITEKVNNES